MSILYAVGATIGFVGNREITFGYKGSVLGSGIRYIMAQCLGYSIDLAILVVFVDKVGFPHQVVQAVAVLSVAIFLFFTFKFYVFVDPRRG